MKRLMSSIMVIATLLALVGPVGAESNKTSAGPSFVYASLFGLGAIVFHCSARAHSKEAGRYQGYAAYQLAAKPGPFYLDNFYGWDRAANTEREKAANKETLAAGLGLISLAFLSRGLFAIEYGGLGSTVSVTARHRF